MAVKRESIETQTLPDRLDVRHITLQREVLNAPVGHSHAAQVVRDDLDALAGYALPCAPGSSVS